MEKSIISWLNIWFISRCLTTKNTFETQTKLSSAGQEEAYPRKHSKQIWRIQMQWANFELNFDHGVTNKRVTRDNQQKCGKLLSEKNNCLVNCSTEIKSEWPIRKNFLHSTPRKTSIQRLTKQTKVLVMMKPQQNFSK